MTPTNTSGAADAPSTETLSALTINEIIARWPQSIGVLNSLGLDTCCGGGLTLGQSAADLSTTEADLVAAVGAALTQDVRR